MPIERWQTGGPAGRASQKSVFGLALQGDSSKSHRGGRCCEDQIQRAIPIGRLQDRDRNPRFEIGDFVRDRRPKRILYGLMNVATKQKMIGNKSRRPSEVSVMIVRIMGSNLAGSSSLSLPE